MPLGISLSYMLPTVGQEASPVVVSLSPHLVDTHKSSIVALLALELGGPLQELLGLVGGLGDGGDVAVALDAEADHRLAGLGDAVDHAGGPAVLDADDDDGGDVGVGAGADQRAKVQIEVGAELQAAIGVRNAPACP